MSSPVNRDPYLNEYFTEREYGDFTAFYVTITICSVLVAIILILNFIFCCSAQYKDYWINRNTGNQYIVPIWTRSPQQQPALDYSELEGKAPPPPEVHYPELSEIPQFPHHSSYYAERETRPHYYAPSVHSQHSKRESDI